MSLGNMCGNLVALKILMYAPLLVTYKSPFSLIACISFSQRVLRRLTKYHVIHGHYDMLTNIYIMYCKCVFLKDLEIYMDGYYAWSPMLSRLWKYVRNIHHI